MPSNIFNKYLDHVLDKEGGYVNHPSDSGGATNFGITEKLAREYGYNDLMAELPLSLAKKIYFEEFWKPMRLSQISSNGRAANNLVLNLFQIGVNAGPMKAVKILQRVHNCVSKNTGVLKVDGIIGPITLSHVKQGLHITGSTVYNKLFVCLAGHYYVQLVEKYPKNKDFIVGWANHRLEFHYD